MNTLSKIYKELSRLLENEPNKNMILGGAIGIIEKHTPELIEEQSKKIIEAMNENDLPDKVFNLANELALAGKGDAAVAMHEIYNDLNRKK